MSTYKRVHPTMAEQIDQSRAWEAYGQVMAAVAAVDLIFKISNLHTRATQLFSTDDKRNLAAKQKKLADQAMAAQFSVSANEFFDTHAELRSDLFRTALDNAIGIRNYLTHKWFAANWQFLKSEEGLDIIAAECAFYKEHFEGIESHIRENGDRDFMSFFDYRDDTEIMIENHPMHKFLTGQAGTVEQALKEAGYPVDESD